MDELDEVQVLLAELEKVVRQGDRLRAHEIAGRIQMLVLQGIEKKREDDEELSLIHI